MPTKLKIPVLSMVDPGLFIGCTNPPGGGRQLEIVPKFPKNCMKSRKFGP